MCLALHFFTWSYSLNLDCPQQAHVLGTRGSSGTALVMKKWGSVWTTQWDQEREWGRPESENHPSNEDKRSTCLLKQEKAPGITFQNQERPNLDPNHVTTQDGPGISGLCYLVLFPVSYINSISFLCFYHYSSLWLTHCGVGQIPSQLVRVPEVPFCPKTQVAISLEIYYTGFKVRVALQAAEDMACHEDQPGIAMALESKMDRAQRGLYSHSFIGCTSRYNQCVTTFCEAGPHPPLVSLQWRQLPGGALCLYLQLPGAAARIKHGKASERLPVACSQLCLVAGSLSPQ